MKITGSQTLPLTVERAYEALRDPILLAKCMPGCEGLELVGPDEYKMKMEMALAAFSGLFDGKIRISDSNPPTSFRLIVEGSGKVGFMKGEGLLTLTPAADGAGTDVAYDGDAQVGGTIAAVGQRMIDTTSRMMIRRFFDKLASEAAAS